MHFHAKPSGIRMAVVAMALSASTAIVAQESPPLQADVMAQGEQLPDPATMTEGPEIKGVLTARQGDRIQVQTEDGARTILQINDQTRVRATGGLFGASRTTLDDGALLNGLPLTIKTLQSGDALLASQITFKNTDFKTASMIRTGTSQQFAEQSAATEALRGRMGDIDQYNVKATTNVYFDTAKAQLSEDAKAQLCAAAGSAEQMDNALMLVVGYTDADGEQEYNQALSEKRAASVINYLQQQCKWKPYRMLTPAGMAEADPVADNMTEEGKAQNRRVAVNILVSKAVDGLYADNAAR
ncbi:OmpA family protein [Blastomonas sp.]|uniref:OmpA family protein n=1 Tax=Blastomonas sp. TaxID=1909299 RepID=UPI0026099D19|nr:OmpA family protein [Blastomonas sp.]MDM7954950.1 OmpA family protein [Blastomonas sp.]